MPNWFTMMRGDKLESCKEFPEESTKIIDNYVNKTERDKLENFWDEVKGEKDSVEKEIAKNPPKLSGVK